MPTNKIYDTIVKKEPITEGWSEDKKYCATTVDGIKYLLRISPLSKYEAKKVLFSTTEQIAALDIPMCLPVEFGICDDGVYTIQSWINGVDLTSILPLSSETLLSETEQYALGLQAGKILKKIHTLSIPEPQEEWSVSFNREIDRKMQKYHECGLRFDGDSHIFAYIEKNRHLLINRPQCFLIWDYNILNMMYENGGIKIIDFEYYNHGDPWNEFCCICWNAMASSYFATGQIHGYFDGEPPMEFFKLLAVYNIVLMLSLMSSWALTSEMGRNVTLKLSQDILNWYDNMKNHVPSWYLRNLKIL